MLIDHYDELEPEPGPAKGPPAQARVSFGLAIGAILGFAAMASTVEGVSPLALSAAGGDDGALFISTVGYAGGVLLTMASLLTSVQPIIDRHGRGLGIAAAILGVSAPITGGGLSALIHLL